MLSTETRVLSGYELAASSGDVQRLHVLWKAHVHCDVKLTSMQAAKHGQVTILEWLRKNPNTCSQIPMKLVALLATSSGRINVLEWVSKRKEGQALFTASLCGTAMRHNQLETLQWLLWRTAEHVSITTLLEEACTYRYTEMAKWLNSVAPRHSLLLFGSGDMW
jgi:hypothetical protein